MRSPLVVSLTGIGALLCVGVIAGCGGSPMQRSYRPTVVEVSAPPLEAVATAQVGESMVKQGRYSETDAIKLLHQIKRTWMGGGHYLVNPGYYVKFADDGEGEYFIPEDGPEGGSITNTPTVNPGQSLFIARSGKEACAINIHSDRFCDGDFEIERTKRHLFSTESFQQTLIYSGRVGNKINIGYRESSNDYARPAFNNEVEYDLNESKIIGYKGAELEILDATNRSITYRVIKNFNSARQ